MSVLLDTNIIIDYSREKSGAAGFIESLTAVPCVSVITVTEIIQGVRDAERPFFQNMFAVFEVLPITHDVALLAGEMRWRFSKSHNLGLADACIAASSQHYDRPLATLNVRDFPMFDGLMRPY
ncbi:MAG: type II toxin-antitoxin system VapC family toxin [Ahrensia sp.]|nr:type II toxin-antitoxin system VapC family toxin [Ahrensia sp.]